MPYSRKSQSRAAGACLVVGLAAGLASVVPVLEDPDYLVLLADHRSQVIRGALAQAAMAPTTVGFALLLHPALRREGPTLALGFVGLRIAAGALHLVGALMLPPFLDLAGGGPGAAPAGELLRHGRDLVNHVGVVVAASGADLLLFGLLRRGRLAPTWLTTWGIAGASLAVGASGLVLARAVDVVSPLYLSLTAPAAVHTVVLAGWLLARGVAPGRPERAKFAPFRGR